MATASPTAACSPVSGKWIIDSNNNGAFDAGADLLDTTTPAQAASRRRQWPYLPEAPPGGELQQ